MKSDGAYSRASSSARGRYSAGKATTAQRRHREGQDADRAADEADRATFRRIRGSLRHCRRPCPPIRRARRRRCRARHRTTWPNTFPNERLVLERNRFYRGPRPQHVDRIVADVSSRRRCDHRRDRAAGNARLGLCAPALVHRGSRARAALRRQQVAQFFVGTRFTLCACSCSTRADRCSGTT